MNDKQLFNCYLKKMESIKDEDFKKINSDLKNGQNSYLRMRMKGSSFFNDEWIRKIEDCIYELGQIVNNPLEVTTTEGSLVPVELAKKINYESIQHLSSHTQYIKDIDEEGNVIPSKILSQFHKEQLHTYENRFIATFIRRLVLFVEKRYDYIKNTVNFETKDVLFIKNKSIVDGKEVEIETKIKVRHENDDAESKAGKEYVKRVEEMRRYVNYFYNSALMKELKTEKNVRKPILQTNIIRKNPLYRKCYETFLFIEKFESLGVEFAMDETYQDFNENERNALNYILASDLLSLQSTEKSKVYKESKKTYKPKLLPSIDDEMFTYGNLLKGPVEFVRVDSKYTEYLNNKFEKDLPLHPNKVEKEYYKDEFELKKNTNKHNREVNLLLGRIKRSIAKWEKIVAKLIEQRNLEEAKEAQRQLDALRKQQSDILEQRRREIIAAASGQKGQMKAEAEARKKAEEEARRREIEEAARKALEEVRAQEEAARLEEEARIAEEAHLAEEARIAEEARKAEEARLAEEAKAAEEAKKVEELQTVEPTEEPAPVEETPVEEVQEEQPEQIVAESVSIEEIQPETEPVVEEPVQPAATPGRKIKAQFTRRNGKVVIIYEKEPKSEETSSEEQVPVEELTIVKEPQEEPQTVEKSTEPVKPGRRIKAQFTRRDGRVVTIYEKEPVLREEPEEIQEEPLHEPQSEPVVEEANVEEPVQEPAPVEEVQPEPEPKPELEPEPESQPEPEPQHESVQEPTPVEEVQPESEPVVEEKKEQELEEPVKKIKSTGKTGENVKPTAKKTVKKPAEKPAKKPEPAPVVSNEPRDVFEKIPGKFFVKSNRGYVVSKTEFTQVKSQARIFDDFNEARRYKTLFGGKVIKL